VIAQRRLVLASGNPGKLGELRALLEPMRVLVQSQDALGVSPADEPHGTFVENALAKARHAARASGWPALADDSGICCNALDGAPGVRSARFACADARANADDAQNNALLLERLAGAADRRAHYSCVIAALRYADDPEPLIADGRWHGEVVNAAQGQGGFGYDPHFWLAERGCTAAQLDATIKNRISHRAIAMQALATLLHERWGW
jgi:XTP/dITP diphosphohydrolase